MDWERLRTVCWGDYLDLIRCR